MQSNKQNNNKKFKGPPSRQADAKRNDNIIFIICILIAALFWGLIKLSDFYTVNYAFKIKYLNIPAEKQLTLMNDSVINVNFNARGYAILKLNLNEDSRQLEVDLNEVQLMNQEGDNYIIYTQELRDLLAEVIEIPETEIDFSKTTVGFVLENLQSKEVTVIDKHYLQFKPQYDLYEPAVITPLKVKVFGPKNILDTLTQVYTEPLTLSDLDKDVSIDLGVQNDFPELLHFEPDIVNMKIRIEKFTESYIESAIDFSVINTEVKSFPATVKINFKLAQKDFNNISPSQFLVVPETEGLDLSANEKIHLKLVRKPDFTRNEWITPTDVEFLIIK